MTLCRPRTLLPSVLGGSCIYAGPATLLLVYTLSMLSTLCSIAVIVHITVVEYNNECDDVVMVKIKSI